jgi:hypothetical protein
VKIFPSTQNKNTEINFDSSTFQKQWSNQFFEVDEPNYSKKPDTKISTNKNEIEIGDLQKEVEKLRLQSSAILNSSSTLNSYNI